ncbi:hypothetical protein Acr_26g0003180 [Actinidia rufa]|uniref:Uncharacterized protein n=1 Tax=Actinidia rufa TaxID=165716 RepID=A0A7J0H207_9ERIC|nr:hypothetical protein Acr_26g0003180 [Actinidia rufa]
MQRCLLVVGVGCSGRRIAVAAVTWWSIMALGFGLFGYRGTGAEELWLVAMVWGVEGESQKRGGGAREVVGEKRWCCGEAVVLRGVERRKGEIGRMKNQVAGVKRNSAWLYEAPLGTKDKMLEMKCKRGEENN